MAYADVDTIAKATRAPGDLVGRIETAFVKQAVVRLTAIATSDPGKERLAAIDVINGSYPMNWKVLVVGLLDIAGNLPSPTDAQIDTQVAAAWNHIVNARRLIDTR